LFQGRTEELALGPYLLLDRVGEGGMGYVFKARHMNMKLGQVVALKLIRKERLADEKIKKRFRREIHAVSKLNPPNIVRAIIHPEASPDAHYFCMEYVEGTDLAKLVKQGGPLPVARASDYVRQAALGLQHAHESGLIHRDVKPHNLLVTRDGVVKLTDLGLARL